MSDPYIWIDPFEEIARADRRAAQSYQEGQRAALRSIERMGQERFAKVFPMAVERLAESVAHERVAPKMREISSAAEFEHRLERERKSASLAAGPISGAIAKHGEIRLSVDPLSESMTLTCETLQPFRYNVSFGW